MREGERVRVCQSESISAAVSVGRAVFWVSHFDTPSLAFLLFLLVFLSPSLSLAPSLSSPPSTALSLSLSLCVCVCVYCR